MNCETFYQYGETVTWSRVRVNIKEADKFKDAPFRITGFKKTAKDSKTFYTIQLITEGFFPSGTEAIEFIVPEEELLPFSLKHFFVNGSLLKIGDCIQYEEPRIQKKSSLKGTIINFIFNGVINYAVCVTDRGESFRINLLDSENITRLNQESLPEPLKEKSQKFLMSDTQNQEKGSIRENKQYLTSCLNKQSPKDSSIRLYYTTIVIGDAECPAQILYTPEFIAEIQVQVTEPKLKARKRLEAVSWFKPKKPRQFTINLFSPRYRFLLTDSIMESLEKEVYEILNSKSEI